MRTSQPTKPSTQLNAPWSLALLAFAGTVAGSVWYLRYRAQHRLTRVKRWTGKRLPRGRWGAAVTAVSGGHPEDLNGIPSGCVAPGY